jgi:hypothetical protein
VGTARAPRDIREDKGRDQIFFFLKMGNAAPALSACLGVWTGCMDCYTAFAKNDCILCLLFRFCCLGIYPRIVPGFLWPCFAFERRGSTLSG